MGKVKKIIIFLVFFLALPFMGQASDFDGGMDQNYFVPENQVIGHTVWKAVDTLDISGTMEKDVYVMAENVVIDGVIKGDLIGVAGNLEINGEVRGNVRFAAGKVKVNGKVGKDLTLAAGTVYLGGSVGWNTEAVAGEFVIAHEQPGDVNLSAGQVDIQNDVGGNVFLRANNDGKFVFADNLEIGGNLEYTDIKNKKNLDKVIVLGEKESKDVREIRINREFLTGLFLAERITYLFSLLLIGVLLIFVLPGFYQEVLAILKKQDGACLRKGAIYLFLIPISCFFLLFTLIGIPLAAIVMALYLVGVYVSKIFVGAFIGDYLLNQFQRKNKKSKPISQVWSMIFGVFLVVLILSVPFIGFLGNLMASILGLGAIMLVLSKRLKK